jgi:prophage maintenance system killer protein/DNA-binding MarR family transcriptional regulator
MEKKVTKQIVIYESKAGAIKLTADVKKETIWASLQQISELFSTDKSGISRHIKKIYESKELNEISTVAKIATVQKEGRRLIQREIEYYNLDMILSIGYRVNSKKATQFRQWANKILKQYILNGYSVNKKLIKTNYQLFQNAVNDIKKLIPSNANNPQMSKGILEIVNTFAHTWLSLDAYDRSALPQKGKTIKRIDVTAEELINNVQVLKKKLINNKTASDFFAKERSQGSIQGIVRSIYQSFGNTEIYSSIEEKASNLLYLIVKNHPFIDGNKRVGAFSFLWFLQKAEILNTLKMSPEVITAITIMVAESKTQDKEKMIGIILQLL